MKIWKFTIPIADEFTIDMPQGAKLLDVQAQGGEQPVLWALVEPDETIQPRCFALRGTGHDATGLDEAEYVGTFQLNRGALVFHLFDRGF